MTAKSQISSLGWRMKRIRKSHAINLTNPKLQIRDTVRYERSPFGTKLKKENFKGKRKLQFLELWDRYLCLNSYISFKMTMYLCICICSFVYLYLCLKYFQFHSVPLKTLASFFKMTIYLCICICVCVFVYLYFCLKYLYFHSVKSPTQNFGILHQNDNIFVYLYLRISVFVFAY